MASPGNAFGGAAAAGMFEEFDGAFAPLPLPQFDKESYVEPLTDKERQVLARIAAGETLAEVALRLGVSRNTAHTHLKHIYQKLRISSRAEATVMAMRMRLIRL